MRHFQHHRIAAAAALATSLLLGGCWWDGSSSDTTAEQPGGEVATPQEPATVSTLVGRVHAFGVSGARVAAFAADANGLPTGAELASTTTDSQGRYTLNLTTSVTGPVLVVATGGTYASPLDGSTQTLGTLATLVPALAAGSQAVEVNPLTNTIAAATSALLARNGGTLAAALASATATVNALFGLGALAGNPQTTAVDPAATSGDGWLLAALIGTLEQLRLNATIPTSALLQALRDDASDGRLDGLQGAQAVALGSAGTLAPSLFTTQWSGAANAYAGAQPQYATAAASISGALQASAQALGIAIGSSGSIAPLQTQAGGTQIYFAARGDGLVKLDMSDPASPTAAKVAAINAAVMRSGTTGLFTSLDGIVINPTPINTAAGPKVFAILYSYASNTVAAVNLTDGTLAEKADLPITARASFSGASAYIAGGIADGKRGRVWLATGDGLLGVDPSNLKAATVAIAQPAGTRINENLGGDPAKDVVFSPDYNNGGLVIFNLAEAKAYVMNSTDWRATVGRFATASFEIDGVALDSRYNVAVMNLEGGSEVGVLAYETPKGATGSVGTLPASTKFRLYDTVLGDYAGAAIDPVSHLALFVGEGSDIGVGLLDDPASATWTGFAKFVRADAATYRFEDHDPHTVGAFSIAGKPYGFVLQGTFEPYKVGVIDLQAWMAAPTNNGSLIGNPMLDPKLVKLVGY